MLGSGRRTGCASVFAFTGDVPTFKRPADAFLSGLYCQRQQADNAPGLLPYRENVGGIKRVAPHYEVRELSLDSAGHSDFCIWTRGSYSELNENGMETGYFNRCTKP